MSKKILNSSREALFVAISLMIGILGPLLIAEIALRFMPVNGGLMTMPVNNSTPIFRFTPNAVLTWSRDWNFSIVNSVRVNNAGFVNNQDYNEIDPRPLFAIVGDSYVEALMVPYSKTLQGRLAKAVAPSTRVYSFAASGAPLSQYVMWAQEAKRRWKANALAIVVIANDFDESLASYKTGPGFHHYIRNPEGSLALRRFDYEPNPLRRLVKLSALARYLFFNLQAVEQLKQLLATPIAVAPPASANTYVGNTSAATGQERLDQSKEAVAAFLRDIVTVAGWSPKDVVFLVDGIRYPTDNPVVLNSYFVQMRHFFLKTARNASFEVVDLDNKFFAKYRKDGARFEFPTDSHWNGVAHELAAEAAFASSVFSRWRQTSAYAK